jgi:hypothetical protein
MRLRRRLKWAPLLAALTLVGCHKATLEDRDNRRLVEQILTALTLKNEGLVAEATKRRDQRRLAGQLADADSQELEAILDRARRGDWPGALKDAYAFRREHPYARRGE